MTENYIHIAFSVDDLSSDYNFANAIAVKSALSNCTSPVCVHILCNNRLNSETTDYKLNKERYAKICEEYNAKLEYNDVILPEIYNTFSKSNSLGTYFRVFAADVLSDIDKVLYLDGDIVVTMDLTEFWNLDIGEYPVAARVDPIFQEDINAHPKKMYSEYKRLGFSKEMFNNYFNTGPMIMRLDIIRKKYNLSKDATEYLFRHKNTPRLEQDALNYIFGLDCYYLEKKYNDYSCFITEYPPSDRIIHYCVHKPWKIFRGDIDYYYWECASQMPWPREYIVKKMLSVVNISQNSQDNYDSLRFNETKKLVEHLLSSMLKKIIKYCSKK